MIRELEILNFLSHKHTFLRFSEGVNVIVGPTDSGKSAIIRALRWLVFNRPMGDAMRSHWGGKTIVTADLSDGGVSRIKTDKRNSYCITEDPNDQYFDAVKSEIPAEIIKLLNLNEINLQTQFESHFLLNSSSGEIASHFNKVAHLDKIDTGLKNIQQGFRREQNSLQEQEQFLKEQKKVLEKFEDIDEIESKIEVMEELEDELADLVMDKILIKETLEQINEVTNRIEESSFLTELDQQVDYVLEIIHKQETLNGQFFGLRSIVNGIVSCEEEGTKLKKDLIELEEEFHENIGQVCPLCGNTITK